VRVITGTAKGHHLKVPKSDRTRPMLEKVRGSLFSVLQGSLETWAGLYVLDLYAGGGSLGIEALSRGAAWCDFVEVNAGACRIIRENLEHTRLEERARVQRTKVRSFLRGTHEVEKYDIIFLDPPYADPAIGETLAEVAQSSLVHAGTLVAVHYAVRVELAEGYGALRQLDRRRLGDSVLSLYGMPEWWERGESEAQGTGS
jgi:16S rRNA (guanine(966)-N(2))-methyltransferase RsmD